MPTKMTISLLQSYDWYLHCPEHFRAKAYQQIVDALNKKPFDSTATIRGQKYEDAICKALRENGAVPTELEVLRGKRQQAWLKPLEIQGYIFRGRMDFDDDNEIWDLKTTTSYDVSSYYDKLQHDVYALAENKKLFTYKIAVFADKVGLTPTRIETIALKLDLESSRLKVIRKLEAFESFLRLERLWDTYTGVYCK